MQRIRGPQSRKRNRYPGKCDHCGGHVEANAGYLVYYRNAWHIRCGRCYHETGLKSADRKGNEVDPVFRTVMGLGFLS
jgi:hypothetical protein